MLESESESESEKLLKKYKKEKMEGKYRPSWDRYLGRQWLKMATKSHQLHYNRMIDRWYKIYEREGVNSVEDLTAVEMEIYNLVVEILSYDDKVGYLVTSHIYRFVHLDGKCDDPCDYCPKDWDNWENGKPKKKVVEYESKYDKIMNDFVKRYGDYDYNPSWDRMGDYWLKMVTKSDHGHYDEVIDRWLKIYEREGVNSVEDLTAVEMEIYKLTMEILDLDDKANHVLMANLRKIDHLLGECQPVCWHCPRDKRYGYDD